MSFLKNQNRPKCLFFAEALEVVDEYGDHDYDSFYDELPGGVDAFEVHDVVEDGDDEYADDGSGDAS